MAYVDVPREAIFSKMSELGFEASTQGREVVFTRKHHRCAHLQIKIYSSLPVKAEAARGCGEDAIRVVVVYEKQGGARPVSFGVYKAKRVHRTGSVEAVLERAAERAREAYAACNERCKGEKRCWECCGRPS